MESTWNLLQVRWRPCTQLFHPENHLGCIGFASSPNLRVEVTQFIEPIANPVRQLRMRRNHSICSTILFYLFLVLFPRFWYIGPHWHDYLREVKVYHWHKQPGRGTLKTPAPYPSYTKSELGHAKIKDCHESTIGAFTQKSKVALCNAFIYLSMCCIYLLEKKRIHTYSAVGFLLHWQFPFPWCILESLNNEILSRIFFSILISLYPLTFNLKLSMVFKCW